MTRNVRSWSQVAQLPAGRYHGISICTRRGVKVGLVHFTSGGLHYAFVDFVNGASVPCYLDGVPVMQPIGRNGRDVGPAITTEGQSNFGDFVVLRAHGGTANVNFTVNPPSSYGPDARCDESRARQVLIDFSSPASFLVSLRSPEFRCAPPFRASSPLKSVRVSAAPRSTDVMKSS